MSALNNYLVLLVHPKESQVLDPQWLKEVWSLFARAVDDMGDLVNNNKVSVLKST